jgi:hypothetical protein
LRAQPLFVVSFSPVSPEAYAKAAMAAMAAAAPPPMFTPFTGAPRFAAAPAAPAPAYAPSHTLRRAGAPRSDAPALRCGACAERLSLRELCLARATGRDASSGVERQQLLFHLRCAAQAAWAAELALQPLLREHHARPPAGEAPLTERELAAVYEELGSDEKRARQRRPG